nr:SCAN domain-containing protein 3-like [Helicoverpa armigera]
MDEPDYTIRLAQTEPSEPDFREAFDTAVEEHNETHQGSQKRPWTQARIDEVVNEIKNGMDTFHSGLRRTAMEYYWMNKYEVITVEGEDQLIFKRSSPEETVIRILPREQYYDFLTEIHRSSEHGGRDKMLHCIKTKYYIPKRAVELFVSLCPKCHTKRNSVNKDVLARQNYALKFNIRGLLDLIDYQICPDGDYQFVLNYQDDATKFLHLRPLKTNETSEVLIELMKIFLTFGAPTILQVDNRHDFAEKLKEEITSVWPECRIVHKNTLAKGNNREVEELLHSWMLQTNSTRWSVGCFIVQFETNDSNHRALGKTPYKSLFGCDPKVSLSVSNPAALLSPEGSFKVEPKVESSDDVPGLSSDEET